MTGNDIAVLLGFLAAAIALAGFAGIVTSIDRGQRLPPTRVALEQRVARHHTTNAPIVPLRAPSIGTASVRVATLSASRCTCWRRGHPRVKDVMPTASFFGTPVPSKYIPPRLTQAMRPAAGRGDRVRARGLAAGQVAHLRRAHQRPTQWHQPCLRDDLDFSVHVYATNDRAHDANTLACRYDDRAGIETIIGELSGGFGIGKVSTRCFDANEAAFLMKVLAFNLLRRWVEPDPSSGARFMAHAVDSARVRPRPGTTLACGRTMGAAPRAAADARMSRPAHGEPTSVRINIEGKGGSISGDRCSRPRATANHAKDACLTRPRTSSRSERNRGSWGP
jgi:Transposase DDE domain